MIMGQVVLSLRTGSFIFRQVCTSASRTAVELGILAQSPFNGSHKVTVHFGAASSGAW